MRQIVIGENDCGQRLDRYMAKRFKTLPSSLLQKYLRKKCVRVNGKHVSADHILRNGDVLSCYINDEFFTGNERKNIDYSRIQQTFSVVYEDDNILIIDKPVGLICQSDDKETYNTLVNQIKAYLWRKNEYDPGVEAVFAPALCNRIDKNTQGLVIAAKNAEALRVMNEKIKSRELLKSYDCLVFGLPDQRKAIMQAYLRKSDREANTVVISDKQSPGFLKIRTGYEVLKTNGEVSWLKVDLYTGRTHQIRAHLAHIGYPILGDTKYGSLRRNKTYFTDKNFSFEHQALASTFLQFDFDVENKQTILDYLNHKSFRTEPFFIGVPIFDGK